jgi:hypothetical protein
MRSPNRSRYEGRRDDRVACSLVLTTTRPTNKNHAKLPGKDGFKTLPITVARQLQAKIIVLGIQPFKGSLKIMTIISILFVLIIIGVVLWLINKFIPMDGKIKSILNVLVVILVILWLLSTFGIIGPLSTMHLHNIRIGTIKLM